MTLRVEENRVSAEIRSTPLQAVLRELADWTGVVFEVATDLNPPVSISLFRTSLQEAVERIASGADSIFYYRKAEAGDPQIQLVRVFHKSPKTPQGALLYIGTGARTKSASLSPEDAAHVLLSGSVEAKERAIEVLAGAGGEAAVSALIKAVDDPSTEVKVAAVEALVRRGARNALARVVALLRHQHPGIRQSAVEAIAELGTAENLGDVRPLTEDPDGAVAAAAQMAVRRLSESRP